MHILIWKLRMWILRIWNYNLYICNLLGGISGLFFWWSKFSIGDCQRIIMQCLFLLRDSVLNLLKHFQRISHRMVERSKQPINSDRFWYDDVMGCFFCRLRLVWSCKLTHFKDDELISVLQALVQKMVTQVYIEGQFWNSTDWHRNLPNRSRYYVPFSLSKWGSNRCRGCYCRWATCCLQQ